jgi:hypothetical protein
MRENVLESVDADLAPLTQSVSSFPFEATT